MKFKKVTNPVTPVKWIHGTLFDSLKELAGDGTHYIRSNGWFSLSRGPSNVLIKAKHRSDVRYPVEVTFSVFVVGQGDILGSLVLVADTEEEVPKIVEEAWVHFSLGPILENGVYVARCGQSDMEYRFQVMEAQILQLRNKNLSHSEQHRIERDGRC